MAMSYAPGINSAGSFPGLSPRTRIGCKEAGVNPSVRVYGDWRDHRASWRIFANGLWIPRELRLMYDQVIRGLRTEAEQPSAEQNGRRSRRSKAT